MIPYVAKYLPDEDMAVFDVIKSVLNKLRDDIDMGEFEPGKPVKLTCHILAEAVSRVFALERCDGYFYPNAEHSWTTTQSGNIIDVYPVAIYGGPILVDGFSITGRLYKEKKIRCDIFGSEIFKKASDAVTAELERLKNL